MSDRAATGEARAILEARALELARPRAEKSAGAEIEVVRFSRGGESYALESHFIHEVFEAGPIAMLPGVPLPMVGATAWRGGVLVLIEPGSGGGVVGAGSMVLAVGEARAELGVVADDVAQVQRIPVAAITDAVSDSGAERSELRGVTREGVLVLDGSTLIRMHTQRSSR